ncbi:B12-binding domain-containing radical SAM protein [Bacillus marasmi]|uniref:B12-binding domain-containing radical SAM protein n=1 Tax=Bacillus marasmi TaxID=1926279 RepID=UPI0011C9DD4E|nr:B12-binding domain-containing radical SAM protein [Bacillus marasmi]
MKIICTTLNAKYIHTNLAIRYLKAYSAPEYTIEIPEYTIKDPALRIVTDLIQKGPQVLGFSCYIWNIEETIRVIQMIKKINPEIIIVLGGPEVSYDGEELMKRITEINVIVTGEGEASFKQLLVHIENSLDFTSVPGIVYRNQAGEIVVNHLIQKIDLRDLPSPFRFEEDIPHLSKRIAYIETSRGCPFNCQFCLSSIEVGVRYFDREKIKEDIRYLMKHGAKTIKFLDRTFNISRSYAMDIFQFLIDEHAPGTVFQFEITADIMRPEVIQFLNETAPPGLFRFEIGVQSTNDFTNELVKRKQNFEKLKRTVTMVKDGGKIDQHLDLIAGLPEEDYQSFRKTFNDVFALRPEELQLGFLKMLHGTGLRRQASQYNYIYMDFPPYEILGNNVLTFEEIISIKQVEDVLEKYWNDHRMDTTIEYLVSRVFPSPFDFFQQFGSFWDEQGWARIGHQLEDLYLRLHQFLSQQNLTDFSIIEGLMKYDYLRNQKYKPRKLWWEERLPKQERSEIYQEILVSPELVGKDFAAFKLSEKDLYKLTVMEQLHFNLDEYLQSNSIVEGNFKLLAYYQPETTTAHLFTLQ